MKIWVTYYRTSHTIHARTHETEHDAAHEYNLLRTYSHYPTIGKSCRPVDRSRVMESLHKAYPAHDIEIQEAR